MIYLVAINNFSQFQYDTSTMSNRHTHDKDKMSFEVTSTTVWCSTTDNHNTTDELEWHYTNAARQTPTSHDLFFFSEFSPVYKLWTRIWPSQFHSSIHQCHSIASQSTWPFPRLPSRTTPWSQVSVHAIACVYRVALLKCATIFISRLFLSTSS